MRTASHIYWVVVWFGIGFLLVESYAIRSSEFDTLSATFKWARESLPFWGGLALSGAVAAVLLWLLSVHWIFSGVDRPGLDSFERIAIVVGAVLGVVGAVVSRKNKT